MAQELRSNRQSQIADDFMQYAKDIARAEKELKIEHWVYITFEIRDGNGDRNREVLHAIDLPRDMLEHRPTSLFLEIRKYASYCRLVPGRCKIIGIND